MAGRDPEGQVRWPATLQQWRAMTFFHWPYDADQIRPFLPPGFEVDMWRGKAWVSLTAFRMVDFRLGSLPPAAGLSTFPETNLRTYVRGPDGRDGLWFLTLEADSLPLVVAASNLYGVPYRWADMSVDVTTADGGETIRYRSRRRANRPRGGGGRTDRDQHGPGHDILVRPGPPCPAPSEHDHWLTGRWRGYSRVAGRPVTVAVDHEPWPLHQATVLAFEETLTADVGLAPPESEPLVHYSPGVRVRLGPPRPVPRPA
jgi:uncharacterized protein YqjF (DUF2071 family)